MGSRNKFSTQGDLRPASGICDGMTSGKDVIQQSRQKGRDGQSLCDKIRFMIEIRLDKLEKELKKYKKKLAQMEGDWAVTKQGSRYGDEYLEMQIKVYRAMIVDVKKQILEEKKAKFS